eukprot:scaffold14737_cov68-Phaeocystis_antarctica.AAC.8
MPHIHMYKWLHSPWPPAYEPAVNITSNRVLRLGGCSPRRPRHRGPVGAYNLLELYFLGVCPSLPIPPSKGLHVPRALSRPPPPRP